MDKSTTANPPLLSARLGTISTAAWQNHDEQGNARGISVSLSKRYFDKKKNSWETSRVYLAPQEVAAAIAVLASVQGQLITIDSQDAESAP